MRTKDELKTEILKYLAIEPETAAGLKRRFREAQGGQWADNPEFDAALAELIEAGQVIRRKNHTETVGGYRLQGDWLYLATEPAPEPERSPLQRFLDRTAGLLHLQKTGRKTGTQKDYQDAVTERKEELASMPIPTREEAVAAFLAEIERLADEFHASDGRALLEAELEAGERRSVAQIRRDYSLAHQMLEMDTQATAQELRDAEAAYNQAIYRREARWHTRQRIIKQITDDYGDPKLLSNPDRWPEAAEARAERIFGERWEADKLSAVASQLGLKRWPFQRQET